MTLENLQQALSENNEELIKRLSFANKDVLKNFSIDKDGNVLYNGEKIISDIKLSNEAGNFIEQRDDGIYVGRDEELANKIDSIKLYQKYINVELDSCFCLLDENFTAVDDVKVPFVKISGNMEVIDGAVKIKPGQRVNIAYGIAYSKNPTIANIHYEVKDITNNVCISNFCPYDSITTAHEAGHAIMLQYTNETDNDCWIALFIIKAYSSASIEKSYSYMTVQEIGHDIIIDPMEYVNDQQGLEDTPVGHILSYMGNTPPKHYLNCDGATYDILDYPYLAEHIREQFGSYNYFGGDGVKTFKVPDLRGEFLRGYGTATRDTGSGAGIGIHQDPTQHVSLYGNQSSTLNTFHNGSEAVCPHTQDKEIGATTSRTWFQRGGTAINGLMTSYYTSRPTNTSVMYCIKYEPTYYFLQQDVIKEISSLDYLEKHADLEGVPVGHILSYMGNNVPKHYLACNGAVYNISEYPLLAEHINLNFGKYNFFGGDGITTFAVPDLRGEFLRGTGYNNHTSALGNIKEGAGGKVGEHQGSTLVGTQVWGTGTSTTEPRLFQYGTNKGYGTKNIDAYRNDVGRTAYRTSQREVENYSGISEYTTRPTNTAVLYCIKYEPTYAFLKQEDIKKVSDDELQQAIADTIKLLKGEEES